MDDGCAEILSVNDDQLLRAQRVAELRALIARGEYSVDAEDVAERIMARMVVSVGLKSEP